MGRSAQDCLEKHCGGLVSDTDIKGILDFRHVPLQPTIGFPVPRKKKETNIHIDASALLRYKGQLLRDGVWF